jgi:hypothetical protein
MIPAFRAGVSTFSQDVTTAGASSVQSTPCPEGRTIVRIVGVTGPLRIAVGVSPVATATSTYLPFGVPEYFLINPGERVAILRTGSTDVTANVVFLSR